MQYHLSIFLFCLLGQMSFSQPQNEILENYIDQAIQSNHGLREQHFLLEKNMLALREAKRLLIPEVGFTTSYSLASGGRDFQLPLGDLMNPVYSALNSLTMSNAYPQIDNETITFLPNNFYDARLRLTQPLLNLEIFYLKKIRSELIDLKAIEIQVFKRELVKDVKLGYYQYLQASEAVRIYDNALGLLAESQRVNENLLRNDKVIPAVLIRIESEIINVKAQRNQAQANQKNALAYFNFLLNRDLESPIETDSVALAALAGNGVVFQFGNREELQQLRTTQNINTLAVGLKRTYKLPKIGMQVEVGSQNFDFKYGGYVLAGLSAEIPLYTANRNKLQVQQVQLDIKATDEKIAQVEKQIELQTATAKNSLFAEIETWKSYQSQLENAKRQYRDTFRRYKEGVSNYIELLDARTQVTDIELQQSLAMFAVLTKQAELERATAAYPLP